MTDLGTHATVAWTQLSPGDVIAERYEVRARLGQGGMGVVWRVLDRELDEEIALKMLTPEQASTEEAHVRFRREVKLARRVTHPNVARTYDLGRHRDTRFFTMELITGESLGSRMHSHVPLAEGLRIVAEVARGLAAAHAQGVVHRDLKPDNVMLAAERVVITDFGIARSEGDAIATSGAIVGTPAYMAPEQLEAREIDGRADVYALGVVLFELVTGRLPFEAPTPFAVAAARLATPAPDPRTLEPSVPDGVASLVLAMMGRQREDRPDAQTTAQRADALRGAGASPRESAASITASMILADRVADGREVRVDGFDGGSDPGAIADDLTRAIRDAVGTERGVRMVTSGGDLVVSGEVRVAANRVRARMRIANKTGAILWASRAESQSSDPFALEDAVVAEVRSAIRSRTTSRRGPVDERLRERWERACVLASAIDPASVRESVAILEELTREAPAEASIQSLLASATAGLWLQTGGGDPSLAARAEELALRALDTDPTLGDAYYTVAIIRSALGDTRAALRAAREATSRSPSLSGPHAFVGRVLCDSGNVVEGMQRLEVAMRLDAGKNLNARWSLLRTKALVGDAAAVRREFARVRGTPELVSLLPLLSELSVWWRDRELCAEVADGIAANSSGGAWDVAVPLLRAMARGEDAYAIARRTFGHALGAPATSWSRTRIGLVAVGYFAYLEKPDDLLAALETVAKEPACLELLFLDRMPLLAPIRGDRRFAEARAVVAARVADLGL